MDTSYVDQAIEAWLNSVESISESKGSRKLYRNTITGWRAWLTAKGRSLDLATWADQGDREAWRRANALFRAEMTSFVRRRMDGTGTVAAGTTASRISMIRSFYEYCCDGFFADYPNPALKVKRPHVDPTGKVPPLDTKVIAAAMGALDRTTLEGARNDAMLRVFLETGRRLSEVARLLWGDVQLVAGDLSRIEETIEDIRFALNFRRIKGGKTAYHEISHSASLAILVSMVRIYELKPLRMEAERPLWPNLKYWTSSKKLPALSINGIRDIVYATFGTSKVHRLRHSYAQQLLEARLPLPDIAALLGHSNLATLSVYLQAISVDRGKNPAIEHIQRVFNIE